MYRKYQLCQIDYSHRRARSASRTLNDESSARPHRAGEQRDFALRVSSRGGVTPDSFTHEWPSNETLGDLPVCLHPRVLRRQLQKRTPPRRSLRESNRLPHRRLEYGNGVTMRNLFEHLA